MRGPDASSERPTEAVVHLAALRQNLACVRRLAGPRQVIAMVKADAYGHGAVAVARALVEAGCERLAVVTVEEGCALRDAGIEAPVLLMGGVHAAPERAVERGLTPVIHHAGHVEALARAASARGVRLPVQVEVDTGMRRMGVPADQALDLLVAVAAQGSLDLEGVYTHLARADEPDLAPSLEQLALFRRVLAAARARGIAPPLVHALNSAGLLAGKRLADALPEANAVRPGLVLYGVSPAAHLEAPLRPALTLRTRVVHLREVRPGEAVGYSALFRAARRTRVATLPLGYADGVPVAASNSGRVWLAGRQHPIAGRVSMDFVGVDVGEAPVALGDAAVVFGELPRGAAGSAPGVDELARASGTLAYEILVRIGSRVPRVVEA